MPYFSGLITGIILTIVVVFVIDHVNDKPASQDIVNWGYVSESVGAGAHKVGEEMRQDVHQATEPRPADETTTTAPATTPAPATPPATAQ